MLSIEHHANIARCSFVRNRFRYRKVFIAWKRWIRRSRMENARVHLLLEGYFSHPILFKTLREIRARLRRLEGPELTWSFNGTCMSLEQYNAANVRTHATEPDQIFDEN